MNWPFWTFDNGISSGILQVYMACICQHFIQVVLYRVDAVHTPLHTLLDLTRTTRILKAANRCSSGPTFNDMSSVIGWIAGERADIPAMPFAVSER